LGPPPRKEIGGPKTVDLFLTTLQLNGNFRANVSGKEHDIDNGETAWKLRSVPYIVSKFHELWSTNG